MSENVINMFGDQMHDDTPLDFLEKVKTEADNFDSIIVIAQQNDGQLFFGGNSGDMQLALWLVMRGLWSIQNFERNLA